MRDPWQEAMLDGDFERAWTISDAVMRQRAGQSCADLPYHLRWVWDGAAFCGRNVLVRCYHGLGDTLQFIRFVRKLAAVATSVVVEAQPALLPLLSSVRGISALYPLGAAIPTYEVAIESMELPHALRIRLDDLPGPIPYLKPPPTTSRLALTAWSRPRRLRVGLVWAAGDWRRERSLPPPLLTPLARLPLDLVCLQLGPARHDPSAAALFRTFASAVSQDATITETAALLCDLDLIVTVDTMVAHLAGALGRPVWALLDSDADWRWMRSRDDSTWYPTMRLFRQTRPGEWEAVVDRLTAALTEAALEADAEQDQCRLVERMMLSTRELVMAAQTSAEAQISTDHDEIRKWAESRGGKPAAVKATHRGMDAGIIRLIFPDAPNANDDSLEEISWDEFFQKFDEAGLALLHQDNTAGGKKSFFNKLIGRDTAEARQHGENHASRHHHRG